MGQVLPFHHDLRPRVLGIDINIACDRRGEKADVTAQTARGGTWLREYLIVTVDNIVTVSQDAVPEIEAAARAAGLTVEVR